MLKERYGSDSTAQESIKTTLELPGLLSGPWTAAESEFGSALVMCIGAHNLWPPPKKKKKKMKIPWIRPDVTTAYLCRLQRLPLTLKNQPMRDHDIMLL